MVTTVGTSSDLPALIDILLEHDAIAACSGVIERLESRTARSVTCELGGRK